MCCQVGALNSEVRALATRASIADVKVYYYYRNASVIIIIITLPAKSSLQLMLSSQITANAIIITIAAPVPMTSSLLLPATAQ